MPAIPNSFDLWVLKARKATTPERQIDYVLGALFGLKEWHFLNRGDDYHPESAFVDLQAETHMLVFSDTGKVEDFTEEASIRRCGDLLRTISIATPQAADYCLRFRALPCTGLLVNPGDYAFSITLDAVESFHAEWKKRGGREPQGFWIPNMTNEEEDFWQQHGL